MTESTAVVKPPADGEWLTNGRALGQMVGVDPDGNFCLDDASCNADEGEYRTLKVTPDEWQRVWFTVSEWSARA